MGSEIEKGLTTIFQTRGRNVTLTTLGVTVRFIRPDVPLAHVTNEVSGLVSPEGQTLPSHPELSIRVFVKDQGAWRITAFHNTILQKWSTSDERSLGEVCQGFELLSTDKRLLLREMRLNIAFG